MNEHTIKYEVHRLTWKPSKIDAWLARNIGFFARRWKRRMQRDMENEATWLLSQARLEVGVAAHAYIFYIVASDEGHDEREERYGKLLKACCDERNALLRYVSVTSGTDAARALAESWIGRKESH